jgi:hypothetical protein
MSESDQEWPCVFRTLHLPGGMRVVETAPGKAQFAPISTGSIELNIKSYQDIANELKRAIGLPILGCECFRDDEEIEGLRPASWRPVLPKRANEWPTHVAELNWSGLSNVAQKRNDPRLYLIAGAITSQFRFASVRLLDLSESYFKNIDVILKSRTELSEGILVRGYFVDQLYSSIHAAFFEMATLRDYIAEYIAYQIYRDTKTNSMAWLFEKIQKGGFSTELEKEIETIYGGGGWLREFSDRRNTLGHRMPFDRLAGAGMMHFRKHVTPLGATAWLLFMPIPDAVAADFKAGFVLPANDEEFGQNVIDELRTAKTREDTLTYLFGIFSQLIDFGNRLRATFPYAPEMVTITDEHILGVKIDPIADNEES